MDRNTIFISHATPEDNDFVRWLGARLVGHGYNVWADLLDLRGGTPFWSSIEDALRTGARKMIFVVSRASVQPNRTGILNELSVADSLRKKLEDDSFIIPLRLDDAPFADLPIQIHRLNAIDFSKGWGAQLIQLLDTLEDARVPRVIGDRTADFEQWRTAQVRTSTVVDETPEPVLTNLMPINGMPKNISFYEYTGDNTKILDALKCTRIPNAMFNRLVVSFADMAVIQKQLPAGFSLSPRARVTFADFLDDRILDPSPPDRNQARNIATSLLRQHVERHLEHRGLKRVDAFAVPTHYFPLGLIANNKVAYTAASGRRTNKNVVGRSERLKVHWHLAVRTNLVLGPPAFVRFKPYVCFSESGQPITDAKRAFAIRRRFCKNWWNAQWRQLQEAFGEFLSEGREGVDISLDSTEILAISGRAIVLQAARRIPDDLEVADEPEDPAEDDDTDEETDLEIDVDAPDTEDPL